MMRLAVHLLLGASLLSCGGPVADKKDTTATALPKPDQQPEALKGDAPFRYPASLYARKVQGKVTLRLFIDADGRVKPESTTVYEASGYPALDSAAIAGAKDVHFVPAKLHGEAVPSVVLLPVIFKHPEVKTPVGDSK